MKKRTGKGTGTGTGTEITLTQQIAGGILLAVSVWAFIVIAHALLDLSEVLR